MDIDQSENICLIDSDHSLHLVKNCTDKVASLKLDKKNKIINLKWINS